MDRNNVILVDENDQQIGEMDKLLAHKNGNLHRAFSIFIFNDKSELLLQQRASQKYHGGDLWTNTCCSHPQPGEQLKESALERLYFEMGLQCDLEYSHSFIYKANVENNLIEHEYDHIFVGFSNQDPNLNRDEAQDFKWMHLEDIFSDIAVQPSKYTYWFKEAFPLVARKLIDK
ncbi:isopentenyl-diphosphate Delta-isomerase [Sphingobacterium rhinopitheci]|uniref:isopentenyl-diphosphate Delta-isomerase n=1 Tax=Sphingobacterium rhinopitheci TaxID=2781960 RepID=UPI001F526070|nr:isopentenyl-diphosphate Delta-isomerase [Sphingobacterium rhinopitheci]MCI0919780.1 isopentenyl-diphosphate Delta-isomerase [Sphingobacterium rhinopitheci]